MAITYEVIEENNIEVLRELCNELMAFQKSKAKVHQEFFDSMNFETRLVPSVTNAKYNYIAVVKDGEIPVGYVYANISAKEVYDNDFATFFDLASVKKPDVGCLSQFYLKEGYRDQGIGSKLIQMSMDWLKNFEDIEDYFVFVSNGNETALKFYERKGFSVSHDILDGFITVLRKSK
ncbi:GNAT family N-acetyltransferase [Lottiidibacillus patelloidae]|uniref:GNAT family N-acetyltransferase n=1 Tax=Lottiidibacillus patelloidae TaxID=2670334 RepID=A0A263BUP7_9BACI|nr:GNAT family N-acetyltransferase [Lottiidibacillus patelloidae]OZM57047.1 GNAT family N-acetyltransferase [Lottiidibacillus patelloidae]